MGRYEDNVARTIKKTVGYVIGGIIAILVLSLIFGSLYTVKEGEVGVMFHKWGANQGFSSTEISQGLHFKMPFRDNVFTIPFRTQTIGFFGSTDKGQYGVIVPKDKNGINFQVDVTVRYKIDPTQASEFVETKGEGIATMETLLVTAVRADSTRGVFGQFAQEDVPQQRIEIAQKIGEVLQERINSEASSKLKPGFITIEAVDLRNVQFDSRIEEAIVNKQTQKQVAERKEYELQQAVKEKEIAIVQAEKTKAAQILVAQGEAAAIISVASAKAKGIQLVNSAYQDMPREYVMVKFAEAIKSTDKVYMGFESLAGGNNLGILNYNQLGGLYQQGQLTE